MIFFKLYLNLNFKVPSFYFYDATFYKDQWNPEYMIIYYTHANKELIFQVPIFVEKYLYFEKMCRASSWLLWIYMLKWLTATQ